MVGYQFHLNRMNCVEKIVDEKKGKIHTRTSMHPHALNEKIALFGRWAETPSNFWQNPQMLKFNLNEYYNS